MTEYSRGLTVQRNAKRLLAALLNAGDRILEGRDRTKRPLTVRPQTDLPGLFVTCTINSLVELTQNDSADGNLTKYQVESAIEFLEEFVGILQRPENQQGSTQQLTINLWEKDKQKNLDRFDTECNNKRHKKATLSQKDPWVQVRKVVPPEFDLLDQTFFHKRRGGETHILKLPSVSKNWSLITQGSYIDRDQQGEVLEQAEKLAKYSGISLLLIRGQPGAGKTALMQWLAYELSGQNRIVLQKKREDPYWLEPLGEFSEQINQHFYLIADDLFRDDSMLEELDRNELQFPLTLIGTTRFNEDQQDKLRLRGYWIEYLDLELSPSPESQEKQRILDRICQQDAEVKARLDQMTLAELDKLMAAPSMLVLMLQLSEGKPFDLIVADVIKRLPSEEDYPVYEVFGVICSFYQFGITTPPEVVALCLPEYSKKAVRNVVDCARDAELKGLVNTISKCGYDGLATIHELIAQTAMTVKYPRSRGENLPYSPNSLKDHLRAAIQALDATKETHKRWASHGLRLLAVNGKDELICEALNDYPNQIQSIQQGSTVTGWFTWKNMYEAVGLLVERDRCLNAILSTKPQSPWEWEYWLSLTERRSTNQQKQEAIAQTSSWLQLHSEDTNVRTKYLALIGQWGTTQQKQEAIAQTSSWLQLHSDDHSVREKYLALIGQCGTAQQKQEAIAQTSCWLQLHPDDTNVRTQYLALIGQCGTSQQKQEAIAQTSCWLQLYSDDHYVREKYLALIGQCGTAQQKQEAIAQTSCWLQLHPDDTNVRTQYLALIGQCGTSQQKQEAIAQTSCWLQLYSDDHYVRTQYLALIGKAGKDIIDVESIISQQWRWFSQQQRVEQSLWTAFLPVLYHHAQPQLTQEAVKLALKQYPDNRNIICLIFGYFRDEIDYGTCYQLADFIRQSRLATYKWQNFIHTANFFRGYGELDTAEEIYQRTIKDAKFRMKKYGDDLQKTINFAFLNYAYLLLLRQPPDPYKAIDYLEPILADNPEHSLAHLYMAKCYQFQGNNYSIKGQKIYQKSIKYFQKAITFDNQKNGHFWYEFGCFYRDAMQNPTETRTCFENSLNQKINLPACVDLAELEVADGNVERARELLQQGLALVPITRPEREQRDKLHPRIQAIQSQLDL